MTRTLKKLISVAAPKPSEDPVVESARGQIVTDQSRRLSRFLGNRAESFEPGKGYSMTQAGAICNTAGHKILFNGDTELNHFNHTEHEIKRRIAICREMYDNVGVVGNVIDLMVDFALEGLIIAHPSQRIQNAYANWAKQVNLAGLAEKFLKSYYRDGNVPILKMRGTLGDDQVRRLRRRVVAEEDKEGKTFLKGQEKKKKKKRPSPTYSKVLGQFGFTEVKRNRIPIRYRIIDVLSLRKLGSELLGTTHYEYLIHRDERKQMRSALTTEEETKAILRFREALGEDAFHALMHKGVIRLDKEQLDVLHYKKDDWNPWATPMLYRIVHDVKFKSLLRDADISLAEGVVNALTIIKLGDSEKKFHPSPKMFQKMIDMMKNPAKSKTIVWDDLITIETIFPPVDKMFSEDKYKTVNDDILAGLGVPQFLINGGNSGRGGFGNAFLAAKTLLERLETGRNLFLSWVKQQLEEVAAALGFQKPAWIKFGSMSLTDDEVQARMMLELVDRNMLSYKTLTERMGENFEIELQRMREEDELRKNIENEDDAGFAIKKLGKFGPQVQDPSMLDMLEEGDETNIEGQLPSGQEEEGNKGGSPRGRRGRRIRETTPRSPQGKNGPTSKSRVDARHERIRAFYKFGVLYDHIAPKVASNRGFDNPDEMGAIGKSKVYSSIIKVMAHTAHLERISRKQVAQILKGLCRTDAGAKLDRCVRSVVQQRIKKFRNDNGKAPSAKKMKEITSSAFAICRSQGLK